MKTSNHPKNLPRYKLLTEKYKSKKVSHGKSQENGNVKMLPYHNTLPVSRITHAHANGSDTEMNSISEGDSGEPNVGQNEYVVEEDDDEVRPRRSRGRLQLRLKKVKKYKTNITIEKYSDCSVCAQERHTKYGSSKTSRKDQYHYPERFSKRDKHDLVCVYDLNDNEVHCEKYNQKIVLVKKYKTAAGEAVYERLVRPSQRLKKINRQKAGKGYNVGRGYLYKKISEVESYRYGKDADDDKGSGQMQSRWSKNEEDQKMSSNESESEFEVEEKQDVCKRFRRVGYRYSRASIQKSQCDQSKVCLKEMDEHKANVDTDVESSSVKELSEDIGMFHCVFCFRSFTTDEALDNHYMTHFTTVHGLNSFLKKQHQKKHSELKRISSSFTKYSKKYDSRVKKNVDVDVDEGVDCTSPGIYSCEIIELQEPELQLPECMKESQHTSDSKEVPKTEEIEQKEVSYTSSEINLGIPNAEECHWLAGSIKDNRCLISSGSETLYCSQNLELAKSCMNRVVKVALSPLKVENDKFIKRSDLSGDLMMKQVQSSLKGEWSLKDRCRSEDSVNHTKNEKERKGSLKITLSKYVNSSKEIVDKSTEKVRNRENELTCNSTNMSEKEQESQCVFDAAEHNTHDKRKVNVPTFEVSNKKLCNVNLNPLSDDQDIKTLKPSESFDQDSKGLDDILNLKFHGEIESEKQNNAEIGTLTSEMKQKESHIALNNNDDINCQQETDIESELHNSDLKPGKGATKKENFNGTITCEQNMNNVDQPVEPSKIVYAIKSDEISSQGIDSYSKLKKNKCCSRYRTSKNMTRMKNRQTSHVFGPRTDDNKLIDKKGLYVLDKTDKMLLDVNENKTENVYSDVDFEEKLELLQENKVPSKKYFEKLDEKNSTRKECNQSGSSINRTIVTESSACTDQKQLNDHTATEDDFHLQNKTWDVINVDTENESRKLNRNDFVHSMPENRDDKKFFDSCCEDMLNEFASELDIVLNSPDNSVMIFDENALYKNLENLNSKEVLCSENSKASESVCTEFIVDNAQVPLDYRELENDPFSQFSVNDRDSLKKSSCNQKRNKLRSSVSLPQVSPDAISACMAITCLQPQENKQENEKSTCNLNDEVSDHVNLNSSQDILSKKFSEKTYFQAAEKYEKDMSSSCDGKGDGKIQSRMRTGSHEMTKYDGPTEMPQVFETKGHRNQTTHPTNSDLGETCFGYSQTVWVAGMGSCLDEMPAIQCTEERKVEDEVSYQKEGFRQPEIHSKSEKDFDPKLNLPALSFEDISVVLEKNSRGHEKNLKNTVEGWVAKLDDDNLKRVENVPDEIVIQKVRGSDRHDKQNIEDINNHYKQNNKVIKIQMKQSHTSELSDVLVETGKLNSSSRLKKRKHNSHIETQEQTKFEKREDVNNNLVGVIDFTNTEEKRKDLQESDATVHRNDDFKPNKMVQWSRIVEKVKHLPLKRFYRCEKCNKLFHAVSTLNLDNYNNFKKGNEIVTGKKRSILCDKHSENAKPNIRDDSSKEKVSEVKYNTDVEMDTKMPVCIITKNKCKDIPKNNARPEQNLKDNVKSSPEQVQEQISLKLVLQKVKNPVVSVGSNKHKMTISPEQPQWKVRDFQTSETMAKDFIEHPTEDVSSNETTVKSNNFVAGKTHEEQISENFDIEKSTCKIERSYSGGKIKENYSEAVEIRREMEIQNLTDSLRDVNAENSEKIKTSKNVDLGVKHAKTDSLVEAGNPLKKVNVKMGYSATKIGCSEELNEFEKALLKGNTEKKKDKVKKKNKQKDGFKTEPRQDSGEKVFTEDNKTLLFRRRNNNSFFSSESMQPFQKSKMAQMIYSKHQKENSKLKSHDGLPDFSETVNLDGLLPLSVSFTHLSDMSPKINNKDSGTCCKISEDMSSSGVDEVTKPITSGIKDFSVASCISNISSASNVEAAKTQSAVLTDSSDCSKVEGNFHSCFQEDANMKKLKGVNRNQTLRTDKLDSVGAKTKIEKDYDRKNFKRLKKELEAIGILKDENMMEKVGSKCDAAFSSHWNSQMTDNIINNFQPVLPSFSDTFSKKRLWPSEKNHLFSNTTFFSKMSESESNEISKTFSSSNDEKLTKVDLNENILHEVRKSPEIQGLSVFDKNCELNELDGGKPAGLYMPCSAELQSYSNQLSPPAVRVRSEFSHMKLDRSTMNFSSTPAVKRSYTSMSAAPCSELNISQISSSSPIQDQRSDLWSPTRRRIKRFEVKGFQSEGNESQRNENILQGK